MQLFKKIGLFILILFTAAAIYGRDEKPATVSVGCDKEGPYVIAKFHRDCRHDKSSGYFKIPKEYNVGCTIHSDRQFLRMPESTGSKLTMEIPVSSILPATPDHGSKVSIFISANEEDAEQSGCGTTDIGKDYASYWKDQKRAGWKYDQIKKFPQRKFEIAGLRSPESDIKSDAYVSTDADGKISALIFCRQDPRVSVCSGDGTPIREGLYNYRITIPKSYTPQLFDIMDALPSLIEGMYIPDLSR